MRKFTFLLLFVVSLISKAQNFTADTLTACDSLKVRFTYIDGSYGATSWQWYFSNGDTCMRSDTTIMFDTLGVYSVMLVVNATDTVRKSNYIRVYKRPISNFDYNDTTTVGSFEIRFAGATQNNNGKHTYEWDFGDATHFLDTMVAALHRYNNAGTYIVTLKITDQIGCEDILTKDVVVRDVFDVPNVFSPNGDGKNDAFFVRSSGNEVLTLSVYSRSGSLVFKNTAKVIIWDGHSLNGSELTPGVYYYTISPENGGGHEKSGAVHLFR